MRDLAQSTLELKPMTLPAVLRGVAPFACAVVLALVAQLLIKPALDGVEGGAFYAKVAVDIGINMMLAVSLTMVNGFTGQFSIGHAAFMAVGAYTAASIMYYGSFRWLGSADMAGGLVSGLITGRDVPLITTGDALFLASLVVGGLVAAGCGYLVGLPSLRLRGDYLAIVTLGFGEIVRVLIQSQTTETLAPGTKVKPEHLTSISSWEGSKFTTDQLAALSREQPGFVAPENADIITAADIGQVPMHLWPLYSGGSLGFSRLPQYNSLFWVVLLGVVTLIVAYRLKNSSMGRALLSIREDEIASEAMGVRTTRYKIYAFVIAAFFAGIAGGLFAHTTGVQLSAGELGFVKSFDIIIMVVLGGLGSISGAALAAVIVTILPELLRKPAELAAIWPWALGIGLVAWVLVAVLKDKPRARGIAKAAGVLSLMALGLALAAKLATTYGVDLTQYRMVLFALALILMMILRPQGLLGVREIWDKALWRPKRGSVAKGAKG